MSRESLIEKMNHKRMRHKERSDTKTTRISNTTFYILEFGSKASRSRYGGVEASSHTLADRDMERVTRLCKMCQRTDNMLNAPPIIQVPVDFYVEDEGKIYSNRL